MTQKIREDWKKDKKFFRDLVAGTMKVGAVVCFLGLLNGLIEMM